MRESCTSGSVRGASSDRRLYSTLSPIASFRNAQFDQRSVQCPFWKPGVILILRDEYNSTNLRRIRVARTRNNYKSQDRSIEFSVEL